MFGGLLVYLNLFKIILLGYRVCLMSNIKRKIEDFCDKYEIEFPFLLPILIITFFFWLLVTLVGDKLGGLQNINLSGLKYFCMVVFIFSGIFLIFSIISHNSIEIREKARNDVLIFKLCNILKIPISFLAWCFTLLYSFF